MKTKDKLFITHISAKQTARRVREILALWFPRFSIHRKKFFVLEEQRIIYVPVSKAANSTVKALLLDALGHETSSKTDPYYIHRNSEFSGFTKRRLPKNYQDYFMFSVVRSEEERLRSCHQNKFLDSGKVVKRGFEFSEYLGGYFKPQDSWPEFEEKVSRIPDRVREEHIVSQSYWIYQVHRANPRLYSVRKLDELCEDLRAWGLKVGSPAEVNKTSMARPKENLKIKPSLLLEVSNA